MFRCSGVAESDIIKCNAILDLYVFDAIFFLLWRLDLRLAFNYFDYLIARSQGADYSRVNGLNLYEGKHTKKQSLIAYDNIVNGNWPVVARIRNFILYHEEAYTPRKDREANH